jgi:hypothetical protein
VTAAGSTAGDGGFAGVLAELRIKSLVGSLLLSCNQIAPASNTTPANADPPDQISPHLTGVGSGSAGAPIRFKAVGRLSIFVQRSMISSTSVFK